MKLPRYLQVALVITAGLAIWSQYSDDSDDLPTQVIQRQPVNVPVTQHPVIAPTAAARINLFPVPEAIINAAKKTAAPSDPAPPPPPRTPPLPLEVMGVWWSQHQRIVIITDGQNSWPVCDRCRVEGKIWLGSTPVSGWTLTDVTQEYLQFEWQPTRVRQQLMLDDLASEPKR